MAKRFKKVGSGCSRKSCDVQYKRYCKSSWSGGHETLCSDEFFLRMSPSKYRELHGSWPDTSRGPQQFRGRKGVRVTKIKRRRF
jgi:hypothetical protein